MSSGIFSCAKLNVVIYKAILSKNPDDEGVFIGVYNPL